ncbi:MULTISPECIES: hypothetical protein [unclassified Amycolatopsis]|uniref:hypothetical protein n=1 Tax=unclassified Amycolatopsis TaxID=2618356 RepID=UPI002E21C742|nr:MULTISPECIES: hypothetical protein [unclassified Amycolatopsis]
MSVVVYLDKAKLQPLIADVWHRVAGIDFIGGKLTTLCGLTEEVEYEPTEHRPTGVKTCWECDTNYRRSRNIPRRA